MCSWLPDTWGNLVICKESSENKIRMPGAVPSSVLRLGLEKKVVLKDCRTHQTLMPHPPCHSLWQPQLVSVFVILTTLNTSCKCRRAVFVFF